MYDQEYRFGKNDRVRLKATVDPSIYGEYACVGNEGVIHDRQKDKFGLPKVYVQWDTNHWAHNGVQDCWTFEDHFELVKAGSMDNTVDKLAKFFAAILADDADGDAQQEEKPSATALFAEAASAFGGTLGDTVAETDEYHDKVRDAADQMAEADAFMVIGITSREHPEAPKGILEPFVVTGDRDDPIATQLVSIHSAMILAHAHRELGLKAIAAMQADA